MKQKTKQEDLMVRYLLGEMTEEEQTQIEERFLNDNEYFEQLLSVEDALIDDYAQGVLTEYERSKVEGLLLHSQRQSREVDFVKDLIGFVSARPADGLNTQNSIQTERPGKLRSLLALLRIRNPGKRFSIAAGLLSIVIILGMVIWNLALRKKVGQMETQQAVLENRDHELQRQLEEQGNKHNATVKELEDERRKRDQLEQELAALQKFRPVNSSNDIAILDFSTDSISRGGGEPKIVSISAGLSRLEVRINLGSKGAYKSYGAVIKTFGGREIWSMDQIKPRQANLGRVVLTMPANIFSNDDYILTLKGQTEAGDMLEIGDYSFRVKT
ncbi:MAG TPA: hypothetical protein VLR90_22170 [Blastocatellia bacterium]|nr:hypothetical protein [Blastocatellia bacterium]